VSIIIKCKYCDGTGLAGFIAASRCVKCSGEGSINIEGNSSELLYEFLEGYTDEDTDEVWLIQQLKRLIRARQSEKNKKD